MASASLKPVESGTSYYTIQKNLPPPPPEERGPRARRNPYPFHSMEVGDSFDAPRDAGVHHTGPKKQYAKDRRAHLIGVNAIAYARTYAPGAKFTVRCIDDRTVRCWRVA